MQFISHKETIYRIQDKDGRGPFKPSFSHKWIQHRSDRENLLPWFVEFGPLHKKLCTFEVGGTGCMTIAQLRRWFTKKEYKKLKGYGYIAVKMDIDRILAFSEIQCFFARLKPLNQDVKKIRLY